MIFLTAKKKHKTIYKEKLFLLLFRHSPSVHGGDSQNGEIEKKISEIVSVEGEKVVFLSRAGAFSLLVEWEIGMKHTLRSPAFAHLHTRRGGCWGTDGNG